MLGDLGSFQNKGKEKGKKLTTEHVKCPRVLCSASLWIHGARKQLRLQLYLLREALGELALPEVFRPVPFIG